MELLVKLSDSEKRNLEFLINVLLKDENIHLEIGDFLTTEDKMLLSKIKEQLS